MMMMMMMISWILGMMKYKALGFGFKSKMLRFASTCI